MASSKVLTKKVGPCGGNGGLARDMNVDGITRIVKISVRHGSAIDALTVRFLRNGHEESTEMWGGKGGNLTEFDLQPTEYITSVKGHIGNIWGLFVLRSLKFETNLKTFGPYGQEDGIPFELPAISGQIIGFHARSGQVLDALGIYVKVDSTTGGISGGGNTGGSTGTGSTGTWTESNENFWDRPAGAGNSGNTGGSTGTTGTWTQSTNNFWDRPAGAGGDGNTAGSTGTWTQSTDNFWDRPAPNA